MNTVSKLSTIQSMIDRYKEAFRLAEKIEKNNSKVKFEFPDGSKYVVDYHGEYLQVEECLFDTEIVWENSFAEKEN